MIFRPLLFYRDVAAHELINSSGPPGEEPNMKTNSQRKLLMSAASSLSLIMGATSVHAADAPKVGATEIETLVVTARKVSENVQTIPVAVTALSPERLRAANIQTPTDLQRVTPSLQANPGNIDSSRCPLPMQQSGCRKYPFGTYPLGGVK